MKKNTNRYSLCSLPLLNLFFKKIVLIILICVLCALLGLGYSVLKVKPTYTASRSVILRTTLSSDGKYDQANQATLGKLYLSTIPNVIKSPTIISAANLKYEKFRVSANDKIISGAVGMIYEEDSLIFQFTYRDKTPELAKQKLEILIETVSEKISQYIQAKDVKLIHTQRISDVVETQYYTKYTGMGLAVGVVISILIVLMIYMLDNTIKSKDKFEEMTGISVLAYIEKDEQKNSK